VRRGEKREARTEGAKWEGKGSLFSLLPSLFSISSGWPPRRPLLGEDEKLGGTLGRGEDAGHCLKGHDFFRRGIGIEVNREGLDQRRAVGTSQRLDPGMGVAQAPALEPDPHRAIEPARDRGKLIEQGFGEEETLAAGGHCAEAHFSTLVAAVQDGPPTVQIGPVMVPIEDPEELLSERVNYKR
jgi:hypothetical protein